MIYKETFKPGLKDIGKDNKVKNRGILEFLENIASYHSDSVGYGANDINIKGTAWILLEWKLEVIKRPKYGQILNINTWARGINKFFTYRDYEVYDDENNLCAIASSKWALINIKNRKMERITEEIMEPYKLEEKYVFSEAEMDKIKIPENYTANMKYKVIRKDIDINKHMHNLYYLDLAYEALPDEIYEKRPFDHVRVSYKKEITLGDVIDCKYSESEEGKHTVIINSNEGKTIHSIIELY